MRADAIGSHGRTGSVSGVGIASFGRLSRLAAIGTFIMDSIHAFLTATGYIKIFRAVAEMDRVFTGKAEME